MHSYLFHVAFDLAPLSDTKDTTIPHHRDSDKGISPRWLPSPHTDIFSTELPVHQVLPWSKPKSAHHRSKTTVVAAGGPERRRRKSQLHHERRLSHNSTTQTDGLDDNKPYTDTQNSSLKASTKSHTARDWRFDQISIESVDMEVRQTGMDEATANKHLSQRVDMLDSSSGLATKGAFVPSSPKSTEVGWGVVRLYRDSHDTPAVEDDAVSITSSSGIGTKNKAPGSGDDNFTTLCILAVPSYMTPSDLLGFVGEKTREEVSHFRLVRTGRANKYMVLMKFREAKHAKRWRKEWNGKLFNSMEVSIQLPIDFRRLLMARSQRTVTSCSSSRLNSAPAMRTMAHQATLT